MARKRKGKANKKTKFNALRENEEISKAPHTFVVPRGHVGTNVTALTMNMRRVMEPYTATSLKMKKKNVMKDLVSIAGPLGVTNLIMFSKSPNGTNLRIARLPRGPTLYFQIEKYCLSKDIVSNLKRPQTFEGQYRYPPLLVLNNFKSSEGENPDNAEQKQEALKVNPQKLCATMLQNMFPSINIHKVKLNHVKRCVAFNYDPQSQLYEFRHYNVSVKPMGMSRRMRKLISRKDLPDLGKFADVSEYLTQNQGEGSASESEAELDGPHNEVELPQVVSGKGNILNQQSAIRLTELGPRMTMKLVKIEEGLCEGEVLYHSLIEKDNSEIKETLKKKEEKRLLKEKRKAEQESNIAKKQKEKEMMKEKSLAGMKRKRELDAGEEDDKEANVDDDAEWYRQEVGEEPDPELFNSSKASGKGISRGKGIKRKKTIQKGDNFKSKGMKTEHKMKKMTMKRSFAKKRQKRGAK